jgi:hypothetical protein
LSLFCAGLVTAQFVAGKAVRDAVYLAQLPVASLPQIVVLTAFASLALVALSSRLLRSWPPAVIVPGAFLVSAALFLIEWAAIATAPHAVARALYLHVSGLGPMLGSGFWLILSDRYDPHTAKQRFGQIAGAGTAGGLLGALIAERAGALLGVASLLPMLAAVNLACAWQARRLAAAAHEEPPAASGAERITGLVMESPRSGIHTVAATPYLRQLAALVLLGSIAAALIDFVFKVQAAANLSTEESLLRFFAAFYAIVSLTTFVIQVSSSRWTLERFGVSFAAGTPSLALFATGVGAAVVPGLASTVLARGAESVFRGSLFRSGYEVFFTPIPPREKRAAKSIVDVGVDRLGDALGGGTIRLVQMSAGDHSSLILALAVACSGAALAVAARLSRGYVVTLERSLLNRAVELELSDYHDPLTRTAMLRTLPHRTVTASRVEGGAPAASFDQPALDPELHDIIELRSRDVDRVRRVLRRDEGMPGFLVPHAIALLAWEPVAADAVFALRKIVEEHVGELIDALIDPNQPFAVRRRLGRVFSVCVSQRAVDGLVLGLDDLRFEVRFQCGRSLAAILDRNPRVTINQAAIFKVVEREVAVGRPVWESRQLLDRLDEGEERTAVDEFLEDRASQSLAHVFTLLSLVLLAEPLRTAYRALHTDDQRLRGTALEYLEGVLPPNIRQRLWPFLEDRRRDTGTPRSRDEIVADLLRSHQSIMLNLEELRRRAEAGRRESGRRDDGTAELAESKRP